MGARNGLEWEVENGHGKSALASLNEALFRQLDRIESAPPDQIEAELQRTNAVIGVAGQVIANGRLIVDAARAQAAVGEAVRVPRGLIG